MNKSLSIEEFCDLEGISRSFFYKMEKQGVAPRSYYLGRNRRISYEDRLAWQQAKIAEANPLVSACPVAA
jgi:excisionase family DNA binding protein